MADDPIAAALDRIRHRARNSGDLSDVTVLLAAVEGVLKHHQPEQLYGMVEDYKGNVVCPHGPDYDGDLHYEDDGGFWYCKALPTVVVCSVCADGTASDLREQWPCPTYAGIASALTGTETPR